MSKLTTDQIKKLDIAEKQTEINFELLIQVHGGTRLSKNNYATQVQALEQLIRHGQREPVSFIKYAEIAKVIRDKDDNIVSKTVVVKAESLNE